MKLQPLSLAVLFALFACESKPRSGDLSASFPTLTQAERDEALIQAYISDAGLKGAVRDASGIYFVTENAGSEEKPNLSSQVTVHYRGTLLNGKQFDSSYDRGQPATFPLSGVVKGWQIGIPKFGKGGKGILLIPSELAYGSQGSPGSIPPNAVLRFDVEVLDF